MSSEASWHVLLEETAVLGDEYWISSIERVEGNAERARERALELAKSHERLVHEKKRSIFRMGDDSFMVVVENDTSRARFRVSVGELIHTEERVEDEPVPDDESERRGFFRRKK
ncbi:hypothetical protein ABZ865_11305 [Streptomyces sp. NPDC047085]|uniref:hypothetical protein n=1 Tax=Streptomyces sp. NPDC047085 TaxID=3155140 RepID=UPI0033F43AFE